MPAISDITLYKSTDTGVTTTDVLEPDFTRKDEAGWMHGDGTMAADEKPVLRYSRRGPIKGQTELTKHTFRYTIPTMMSLNTEASGDYAPKPKLDYVTVAELTVWTHGRSSYDEKVRALAAFARPHATLVPILDEVIAEGKSIY